MTTEKTPCGKTYLMLVNSLRLMAVGWQVRAKNKDAGMYSRTCAVGDDGEIRGELRLQLHPLPNPARRRLQRDGDTVYPDPWRQ